MGIYINDVDMPKQDEILQIRIYGDGKVSRVYDIECQQIGTAIESTKETAMTRDEAIKALTHLREIIKEIPKALCKLPNVEERKRENIIALRMAIESLQAEAEWIPVSEKLPNENARYLVQMSYGLMQVLSWANVLEKVDDFDFYNEKHGGWYELDSEWGYCERHEVVAWMPLPEPYREDDE